MVGDGADIVLDRGVDIGKRAYHAVRLRPAAGADGRRTFGRSAPASFQFVERCIELTPLAAREKSPLQGILKPFVILTVLAAGDLCAGAANVQAVQDRMVPRTIIGALSDHRVQL